VWLVAPGQPLLCGVLSTSGRGRGSGCPAFPPGSRPAAGTAARAGLCVTCGFVGGLESIAAGDHASAGGVGPMTVTDLLLSTYGDQLVEARFSGEPGS